MEWEDNVVGEHNTVGFNFIDKILSLSWIVGILKFTLLFVMF